MRAFAPLAATLALVAAAAGCASPPTPNETGAAGGSGNTTGVAGGGGTSTVVMCGPQTPPAPSGGANSRSRSTGCRRAAATPRTATTRTCRPRGHVQDAPHRRRQPRAARAAPVGQQRHRVGRHGVRDVVRRLHQRQGDVRRSVVTRASAAQRQGPAALAPDGNGSLIGSAPTMPPPTLTRTPRSR